MELSEILKWYDRDQRHDAEHHGARREATEHVVRHVDLHGPQSYLTWSSLNANTADAAIREQKEYYGHLGHSFEWAAFSHDQPPDLKERLLRHGFEAEETEAIVVLELESMGDALRKPVPHDVRRIREVGELADVIAVGDAAWGTQDRPIGPRLKRELEAIPDRLSVYVAHNDGIPACAGWMRFSPGSPFASLWGGATVPRCRKRGLYTALVAARAQEAWQRGAKFLTVDARSLSRPILEKLGFRVLTQATPMQWRPT
jgi:hypothetical protein